VLLPGHRDAEALLEADEVVFVSGGGVDIDLDLVDRACESA
jgi:hypothetical protein